MITIIAFLILLGVLVVIHEGGHFFVLRMCKVHVDRFSVGMGPVIYKKKDKKGTEREEEEYARGEKGARDRGGTDERSIMYNLV